MKAITKSAFYHLKNVAKLTGLISKHEHLCCNGLFDGLLLGLPKKTIQLILNAAARVLTKTKGSDHINAIPKFLHWLPVNHRTDSEAPLLVYKSPNTSQMCFSTT